ncbi:integral membrane protein [Diaporthe amygdali]|uniref:uncharacterized protein n=1 Tax=Phomopsis amygdali TaxID=1214568 RepID=UPI0022FE5DC8|nr:uncharacterized protein J7T55_003742 [Diaporthe amygdali]KAJ0117329.1 integral membrane protein [Diaporthe amygdali]
MASQGQLSPEMAAENKGPGILAACYTVEVIASLFVAARLFVRGRMMGKWQLDDWLIILSMLFGWIAVAFTTAAVASGSGKHFEVLTESQHSKAIFWTVMGFGPGVMSFGIPKLAVVAFLTHIMNPSRVHRIIMWMMASLCVFNLFICVVFHFAQCSPAASQWDFSLERRCWSPWILIWWATWSGYFSAFLDLYFAVYPSIVLYKLQMNRKKKLALCAALGIGSISTIVAVYKTTRLPSLASGDFTFSTSDLVVFTIAEGGTIIIAACIPVLQPLLEMITGKRGWLSSDRTSGGRPYQQHYGRGAPSYGAEKSVRSEFEPRRKRRVEDDDDLLMTSVEIERAQAAREGFWPPAGEHPPPRSAALPRTPSRASSRTSIRANTRLACTARGIFSRPRRSEDAKSVTPVITKTQSIMVEYEPYNGRSGSWPLSQDPFPMGDSSDPEGGDSAPVTQRSFSLGSVTSHSGAWKSS